LPLVFPKSSVKNGAPAKKRARTTVFLRFSAAAAKDDDRNQNDDPAAVVAAEQGVEACHKSTRSFLKAFERRGSPPSKVEYAIGRHVVTQRAVVQRKVAKSSAEFPLFGKKQERPCQNTNQAVIAKQKQL
jgi:hypothetical protein